MKQPLNGKYVVKPWKLMELQYGLDSYGDIQTDDCWLKRMEELCPLDRVIEVKYGEWEGYDIIPEMLIGPAFEYLEEILVSDEDDIETAKPAYFIGYTPGHTFPVSSTFDLALSMDSTKSCFLGSNIYRYAWPLSARKPKKTTYTVELTEEQAQAIKDLGVQLEGKEQ